MKSLFIVFQDMHDSYGGGEWSRSYYETKEEAIELMQESLNENQSCLNDFVLEIDSIKNIPCHIVHGRYDIVCPFDQAYDLHAAYRTSVIHEITDAGHSLLEEGITKKILEIYHNDEEFIT